MKCCFAKQERQPDLAHGRIEPSSTCESCPSLFNGAFTLLEVMIAMALFFMAVFSILALVSNGLRNARALQQTTVDAGTIAAELSLTNKLTEGTDSGDFGDSYPDYKWTQEITEVKTNGLFEVKFIVIHHLAGGRSIESPMSIYLFRPESPTRGPLPR